MHIVLFPSTSADSMAASSPNHQYHSAYADVVLSRALARYLGRPVPAFRAMPISALNFCSYDGVLRGPFAFRLSADELKHPSVHSTDHK